MHRVLILGSTVRANTEYSMTPTGLHGKSGRPFRRAIWTRQSRIVNTARRLVISRASCTLRRA